MADQQSSSGFGALPQQKAERCGQYRLRKRIGKGNFAVVKLGSHMVAHEKVAIKIVDKNGINSTNLNKIHREINILKSLTHPHVIKLYQVMESDRYLYIVTEYAGGGEFFSLLVGKGRQEETESRRLFRQLVSAVAFCHSRGVVHRDLKAENVLLDRNNNVKLIDFGFSNYHTPGEGLSTWCGSPPYAAPELFLGQEYDGTKADVWSLGVILYILVSGGFPFPGTSMEKLKRAVLGGVVKIPYWVSVECSDLIRKMLVVVAAKRYSITQVTHHRWFVNGDMSDEMRELLRCSLSGDASLLVPAETTPLNQRVLSIMYQHGSSLEKVTESLIEKRFDDLYATYHILCDKMARRENNNNASMSQNETTADSLPVVIPTEQPRRGSRGSITTGVANIDLTDHLQNLSATAFAALNLCSSSEEDVKTANAVEPAAAIVESIAYAQPSPVPNSAVFPTTSLRRHTLVNDDRRGGSATSASNATAAVAAATLFCPPPPSFLYGGAPTASMIGQMPPQALAPMPATTTTVPFPLDQAVLWTNLAQQPPRAPFFYPYLNYLAVPTAIDPYNPMRRASDGETPQSNSLAPIPMDQTQADNLLSSVHEHRQRQRSSTDISAALPLRAVVDEDDDDSVDLAWVETVDQPLVYALSESFFTGNATSRHSNVPPLHLNASQNRTMEDDGREYLRRVGRFKRNTIHGSTDLPLAHSHQHLGPVFAGRHSISSMLAADRLLPYGRQRCSTGVDLATGVGPSARRGSSPAGGDASVFTAAAVQLNHLLTAGLLNQWRVDRDLAAGNTILQLQHELKMLSTDVQPPVQQQQQLSPGQTSSAQSTPPHAGGGTSPLDMIAEQGASLEMLVQSTGVPPGVSLTPRISITNEFNQAIPPPASDHGALHLDPASDPIYTFQQQAQQIIFGRSHSATETATTDAQISPEFNQYYYSSSPTNSPMPADQPPQQPHCVLSNVAISQLFAEVKRILDQKQIQYQELLSPQPPGGMAGTADETWDGHSLRRLSLESDDGMKMEIGVSSAELPTIPESAARSKLELRCLHGDFDRYTLLCKELISGLQL